MTLKQRLKKLVSDGVYGFVDQYVVTKEVRLLRFLKFLHLDLWLFSLPWFLINNVRNLKKLIRLKKKGAQPTIIFWQPEIDGRFERVRKMGEDPDNEDSVWFKFYPSVVAIERVYFDSFHRRKLGRYEDVPYFYVQHDNDANRGRYRAFLNKLFDTLESIVGPIDFYLAGSQHDIHIVEMVEVGQKRGISFLINDREGIYTTFTRNFVAEQIKRSGLVKSHYVFAANHNHAFTFEVSRQPSVRSVEVIGELDTDYFFHFNHQFDRPEYQEWNHYRKKMVFLTFGTNNYIEPYAFPNLPPDMNWVKLLAESEDVVLNFAKEHNDIAVFYKMGHYEDLNHQFLNRCKVLGITNIIPLGRAFPCSELMMYADLTVGFLTTAMYEAMFGKKPLWYTHWSIPECVDQDTMMLPLKESGACRTLYSAEQFKNDLHHWAKDDPALNTVSKEELEARAKSLDWAFHRPDGKLSEHFFQRLQTIFEIRKEQKKKCHTEHKRHSTEKPSILDKGNDSPNSTIHL